MTHAASIKYPNKGSKNRIGPWLYVVGGLISVFTSAFLPIFFCGSFLTKRVVAEPSEWWLRLIYHSAFLQECVFGTALVAIGFTLKARFCREKTGEWRTILIRDYAVALLFHAVITVPLNRAAHYWTFHNLHSLRQIHFSHLFPNLLGWEDDFFMMASFLVAGVAALISSRRQKDKVADWTAWVSVLLFLYFVCSKDYWPCR